MDQLARATGDLDFAGQELDVLVAAAAGGDEQAWATMVRRYSPLLARALRRYRLDDADAADIIQLTWLRLVEHLPLLREPRALVGWLLTTARREAYRLLRQSGRIVPVPDVDDTGQRGQDSPEDQVERKDRDRQLRVAVSRLPKSDRELLGVLLTSPPPSYREAAASLGRPVGSIGPTRARCLARLRRELTALDGDPGRLAVPA